ncbi:alpha-E domain-containing protein [Telmatospirillum sp.]|uniref:alpha-E domain-containing protein n=1 Tax=Telmatospirillum sp. TaxID=2079197 RepID=UPI00283ABDC9|nr:alpha-E domain-containing protein [Telmatospirillum sp.]MDR3440064.1 alpha-E domain-containing protein [Telmatospirillum sp.]
MLSRTAEQLYWTGRYVERAENMARILDVSQRLSVQGRKRSSEANEWVAVLDILCAESLYAETHGEVTEDGVIAFLTLDRSNPSSIYSCLHTARENARALRSNISSEMWESMNTTWLAIRELTDSQLQAQGLREFFDWVKVRSHLFRGVSYTTTLHDDGFAFIRLGTFLERADNTARLLDSKFHILADSGTDPAANYYEWGAVLRAVGAFRAYHQLYHDVITPLRVAELLVLHPQMPRSLRFCFDHVSELLGGLSAGRRLECERMAGEFCARLQYGQIEKIHTKGLHDFLMEVLDHVADLSQQISHDFMMTV